METFGYIWNGSIFRLQELVELFWGFVTLILKFSMIDLALMVIYSFIWNDSNFRLQELLELFWDFGTVIFKLSIINLAYMEIFTQFKSLTRVA